MKQLSEACERNKKPILEQLEKLLKNDMPAPNTVLEVGSGTGQHAAYFSKQLPWLQWQPSDLIENHSSIDAWRKELGVENCLPAIEVDLDKAGVGAMTFGNIFTANTLHIVSWHLVGEFFKLTSKTLIQTGRCIIYGPFNYKNRYTSISNARFDDWLKSRDSRSGIRDFEAIEKLANSNGLQLQEDLEMPSNNRLLVFKKS